MQEAEGLHAELLTLLDIWRDYRADTDAAAAGPLVEGCHADPWPCAQ